MKAEYRALELQDDELEHDLQMAQTMCTEAMAERREREDTVEELSIFIEETRASIDEVVERGHGLQDRLDGRQLPKHRSRKPASQQARSRGGVRQRQGAFSVDGSERSIGSGEGRLRTNHRMDVQQFADQFPGNTPEEVAKAMGIDTTVSLGSDTTQLGEDQ